MRSIFNQLKFDSCLTSFVTNLRQTSTMLKIVAHAQIVCFLHSLLLLYINMY